MHAAVLEKDWGGEAERLLSDTYYSGTRIVLTGKEGTQVAIVPLEDLGVLEELEKEESDEK
jgi:hypothetical protein